MRSPSQLTGAFRAGGLKVTPQRQLLFGLLYGNDEHPTAETLHVSASASASARIPGIPLRTVYQTLTDLASMGELRQLSFGTGPTRFDPNVHGQPPINHRSTTDQPDKGVPMPELDGTKTHENLKEAFAGESQANRRYMWFAQRADIEGYPDTAALFRSVAEGETGHAHGHLEYLAEVGDPASGEPIGDTEENLKASIAGETYEYTQMYPGFAATARDEGFDEIAEWFETLARAEKSHAGRFSQGLESIS